MSSKLSQNVAFSVRSPRYEYDDWAPGGGLAYLIASHLRSDGWQVEEPDVLTGSTWTLSCKVDDQSLRLNLANLNANEWIVQIIPYSIPSWFGRIRGKAPSATDNALYDLAKSFHSWLLDSGCKKVGWCWDDDPRSLDATSEPLLPHDES